jgi:hypothetical protein
MMLEHLTGGSAENSIGSMQAALSRRTFLKVSGAATHISNRSPARRNGNWKMASRDWRLKPTDPGSKI